jgi:hypothetical protein
MKTGNDPRLESIYVELDCVLDTRLGTIARISDEAALMTLQNGYHDRRADIFEFVEMDAFKTLYAQRDGDTLSKSMCTGVVGLLRHLTGVLAEQAIERPFHSGGKVVLNTFPYNMTTEVQDEIGMAVSAWIHGLASVEVVSVHPESLTPAHCKRSYAVMVVYDYGYWLNLHAKAFESTRLPEVQMFGPALLNEDYSDDQLEKITAEAAHPVRALEMLASPLISLKLIDARCFSVISPPQ